MIALLAALALAEEPPRYDPTPTVFQASSIRHNELGYHARGAKELLVVHDGTEPLPFTLTGPVELTGSTEPLAQTPGMAHATHLLSLPRHLPAGRYVVRVADSRKEVVVADRVYDSLSNDALQAFFLLRSSVDTGAGDCAYSPHGCAFTHGPGTPMDAVAGTFGDDDAPPRDVSGGWGTTRETSASTSSMRV